MAAAASLTNVATGMQNPADQAAVSIQAIVQMTTVAGSPTPTSSPTPSNTSPPIATTDPTGTVTPTLATCVPSPTSVPATPLSPVATATPATTPITKPSADHGYEKTALSVAIQTEDPSDYLQGNMRDAVGIDTRGYIIPPTDMTVPPNSWGRVWGLYSEATILNGADGLAYCAELQLNNGGTDQSAVDTYTSKYGLHIVVANALPDKRNNTHGTAALYIDAAAGLTWHKGLYANPVSLGSGAKDSFLELYGKFVVSPQGTVAIGTGAAPSACELIVVQPLDKKGVIISADACCVPNLLECQVGSKVVASIGPGLINFAEPVLCFSQLAEYFNDIGNLMTNSCNVDWNDGNIQRIGILAGTTTVSFTNVREGAFYRLIVNHTAASSTVDLTGISPTIKWQGGAGMPVLSTGASTNDIIFLQYAKNTFYAWAILNVK